MEQKRISTRVYKCGACRQSGILCKTCGVATCRTGILYDDHKCLSCSQSGNDKDDANFFDWPKITERRDILFSQTESNDRLIAEMTRDSQWRDKAMKEGLERLFLLLVSMPGFSRNQIAGFLGFSLLIHPSFGDPHQEAWTIVANFKSRSTESYERINPFARSCNWLEMMLRVGKTVHHSFDSFPSLSSKQAQQVCTTKSDILRQMEENFLGHMLEVAQKHRVLMLKQAKLWQVDQGAKIQEELDQEEKMTKADAIIRDKIMKNGGFSSPQVINYGVSLVKFASGAPGPISLGLMAANWLVGLSAFSALAPVAATATAGFAMIATPLFFVGIASLGYTGFNLLLGSSHGRMLEPVLMIISQRFLLAARGFNINQFIK